jgi:hypothetical protein
VHGLLIASPTGSPLPLTAQALNTAARERWGEAATVRSDPLPTLATNIWVEVEGQPFFQIDLQQDLSAISCDGNDDQTADVAVWVRSLLPADAPRIIATDEAFSCHVELVPGITVEQFRRSVIDHSLPGWNDGDPDLG